MEHTVKVTQISNNLWNINQPWYTAENKFGNMTIVGQPYADAYLICGTEKAVLIDCLMESTQPPLPDIISRLTSLPIEVYFTHGHGDHVGAETGNLLNAGYPLHLSHLDFDMMKGNADRFFGFQEWMDIKNFQDITPSEAVNLGDMELETFLIPGHTKGCICFLDRQNRRAFTGDAFGTIITGKNFIMDSSSQLSDYLDRVKAFEEWVDDDKCILYNGHLTNVGFKPWTIEKLRENRLKLEGNVPK